MPAQLIKEIRAAIEYVAPCNNGLLKATCCFNRRFVGFAGHFPEAPILPALVQVLLGQELIRRQQGEGLRVAVVRAAKFKRPLGPDEVIEVRCFRQEAPGHFAIELRVAGRLASSFRLEMR